MANGVNRRKKGRLFRASSSSVQTNTNKVKCSSSDYCGTDALPAVTGHKWPISLEGASRTSRWLVLAARQGWVERNESNCFRCAATIRYVCLNQALVSKSWRPFFQMFSSLLCPARFDARNSGVPRSQDGNVDTPISKKCKTFRNLNFTVTTDASDSLQSNLFISGGYFRLRSLRWSPTKSGRDMFNSQNQQCCQRWGRQLKQCTFDDGQETTCRREIGRATRFRCTTSCFGPKTRHQLQVEWKCLARIYALTLLQN